jgi:hypothetical protein
MSFSQREILQPVEALHRPPFCFMHFWNVAELLAITPPNRNVK